MKVGKSDHTHEHAPSILRYPQISPQENMAPFSSFGAIDCNLPDMKELIDQCNDPEVRALQDLRIQPTVVAPGEFVAWVGV